MKKSTFFSLSPITNSSVINTARTTTRNKVLSLDSSTSSYWRAAFTRQHVTYDKNTISYLFAPQTNARCPSTFSILRRFFLVLLATTRPAPGLHSSRTITTYSTTSVLKYTFIWSLLRVSCRRASKAIRGFILRMCGMSLQCLIIKFVRVSRQLPQTPQTLCFCHLRILEAVFRNHVRGCMPPTIPICCCELASAVGMGTKTNLLILQAIQFPPPSSCLPRLPVL